MAGATLKMAVVLVVFLGGGGGGRRAAAQVHHVVGNDQGWATSTDLESWLSGRLFEIGDTLWFAYSSASESIMELQTLEEFLTCDLTNPIRKYTNGLDRVPLDTKGTRYFTSANLESCRNGLKVPVNVQHRGSTDTPADELPFARDPALGAEPPASPSDAPSQGITTLSFALLFGLVFFSMGI